MQTDILRKTDLGNAESVRSNNPQDRTAQDQLLQDELMQELAHRKSSLESLACEDANESFSLPDEQTLRHSEPGATVVQSNTLRDCVEQTLRNYFTHLDGQSVTNIYEMVLSEVEAPLLEVVMRYTQHNQCKAAELLGLSRGTLRKKLQQHGLL